MLIYQKCGCGCEVRPVCAPKSGRARCVLATQKTVATHTLDNMYLYKIDTKLKKLLYPDFCPNFIKPPG